MRRGLALILVVGVLAVLAVLGSAFAVLSRLERKAASMRVTATRARLLARSGMEDAVARLTLGQDPSYGGENWDGSSDDGLNAFEAGEEVFRPTGTGTSADVLSCPIRHAMRPSFFARALPSADPALVRASGKLRGFSGTFDRGGAAPADGWALRVEDANARIFVNGGALDALDRDPDGPDSAPEGAPLAANGIPDHRDVSMEGPNGFLVRLLNNLDTVVAGGNTLGNEVVGGRPPRGYLRTEDLKGVLGAARYAQFKDFLTVDAWVDPTVLKPQPMDGRPRRWEDIDDAHRIGTATVTISGSPTVSGISGAGTEASPWTQNLHYSNLIEGTSDYAVRWERQYVYAWRQLRLAPLAFEPRAPVALNSAPEAVLASVFLGLRGSHLEVWEGNAGWDGCLSFFNEDYESTPSSPDRVIQKYPYPRTETEDSPWHRTRADFGMEYGSAARPWYPASFDPLVTATSGCHTKPLVQSAPLGRLRETVPLTQAQARAVAAEVRRRVRASGPFRTWQDFNAFVDALPAWEDVNEDGILDGAPYSVTGSAGAYTRRIYMREDFNGDGSMNRQVFTGSAGAWTDRGTGALQPGDVPGLSFLQKDAVKAMANPNTDLNDFNPDANLWKELDKTDLAGIGSSASSYAHTTELSLNAAPAYRVRALGRSGRDASSLLGGSVRFSLFRDTTQADFMRGYPASAPSAIFVQTGPAPPYPVTGGQPLVSYPEPQTAGGAPAANATYDGQIGLGFVSSAVSVPWSGWEGNGIRSDLFDTLTELTFDDVALPETRGPFQAPLIRSAGQSVGSVLPDGVYSEKDASIRFAWGAGASSTAFWMKLGWFPEASPRAHALLSQAVSKNQSSCKNFSGYTMYTPIGDLAMCPYGLFFVPARNNFSQSVGGLAAHNIAATRGYGWPARCLLFGTTHGVFMAESLNRRGNETVAPAPHPLGRLEAHRWVHVVAHANATTPPMDPLNHWLLILGRHLADPDGGGGWGVVGGGNGWWHDDGSESHLRLGESSAFHNMNYPADATFANVRQEFWSSVPRMKLLAQYGRYFKEHGAAYLSAKLPAGFRPARATWTEIPCTLWFDEDANSWMGDAASGYQPRNDRDGNGKRDVRVDLEVYDDTGLIGRLSNPEDRNLLRSTKGRVYYKAVWVNEWDGMTRVNHPLDVTPFLDDVTFLGQARMSAWAEAADD